MGNFTSVVQTPDDEAARDESSSGSEDSSRSPSPALPGRSADPSQRQRASSGDASKSGGGRTGHSPDHSPHSSSREHPAAPAHGQQRSSGGASINVTPTTTQRRASPSRQQLAQERLPSTHSSVTVAPAGTTSALSAGTGVAGVGAGASSHSSRKTSGTRLSAGSHSVSIADSVIVEDADLSGEVDDYQPAVVQQSQQPHHGNVRTIRPSASANSVTHAVVDRRLSLPHQPSQRSANDPRTASETQPSSQSQPLGARRLSAAVNSNGQQYLRDIPGSNPRLSPISAPLGQPAVAMTGDNSGGAAATRAGKSGRHHSSASAFSFTTSDQQYSSALHNGLPDALSLGSLRQRRGVVNANVGLGSHVSPLVFGGTFLADLSQRVLVLGA